MIWTQQELAARLADKDGVLTTGSQRMDAALLAAAPRLKICANMAVGYNNFDVDAMTAAGVQGTNTPDVLTETTADFGFALLMATARRMTESEHYLRAGKWTNGATTCSRAATSTAARWASSAWAASDRALPARRARLWHEGDLPQPLAPAPALEAECKATYVGKEELLRTADHVVLVVPYTAASHHTIGAPSWR